MTVIVNAAASGTACGPPYIMGYNWGQHEENDVAAGVADASFLEHAFFSTPPRCMGKNDHVVQVRDTTA
jgi:hypothetical protein